MEEPPQALVDLAWRLLGHASRRLMSDAGDCLAAAELVCGQLVEKVAALIGTGGTRRVLLEALAVATRRYPDLRRLPAAPCGCVSASGRTPLAPEVWGPALALWLAYVLWLLCALIGEDLTLQILCQSWPEMESGCTDLPTSNQ